VALGEHRLGRHRAHRFALLLGVSFRNRRERQVIRRLQRRMMRGGEERVEHLERRCRGCRVDRSLREAPVDQIRPAMPIGRVDCAVDGALHHRQEHGTGIRRRRDRRLHVDRVDGDLVPLRDFVAGLRKRRHDECDSRG
jgi:hypothetical protein